MHPDKFLPYFIGGPPRLALPTYFPSHLGEEGVTTQEFIEWNYIIVSPNIGGTLEECHGHTGGETTIVSHLEQNLALTPLDFHLIEEGGFIGRGEEKWRERRGGKKWRESAAGRKPWREEMAGIDVGRGNGGRNGLISLR